MEIYLIRHTTPQIEKGICYGQSDIPLTESFHTELHQLKTHLPELFDVVYSSPMSRCTKLAQFIQAKELFIPDRRLLEMNFGDWEMKNWDEINQDVLNEWMKDFVNVRVPKGENFIDLNERVTEFIDELLKTNYKKVAIVTHAGVIRCVVAKIVGMQLTNAFKISVDYSSVTKIHGNYDSCYNKLDYLNRM